VFLWLEARSDHRSFDVSLFTNRGYAVSLTAVSMAFFALSGITFTLPFYLQIVREMSTLTAGLCFLPFAVGQLLSAPRSNALVNRFGYRVVMTSGLAIVGVALVGFTRLSTETPMWAMLLSFFLFGMGMGAVIAPASTVMQNVLPLARAGAGSAVQNTVRQVFGALGVAVISTLLATRFAAEISTSVEVLPASEQDNASQSLGTAIGAFTRAGEAGLPPEQVEQGISASVDAFMTATHLTSLVSALVVFAAAIVVATRLPHIVPPSASPEGPVATHEPDSVHDIAQPGEEAAVAAANELELDYPQEAAEEYRPPRGN
jgi:MFS family permease